MLLDAIHSRVPLVMLSALIFTTVFTGCERGSQSQPDKEPFIAIVGAGQDHVLWPVIRGTAMTHWEAMPHQGWALRIEAPRVVSSNAQAELVRELARDGMRALCIQVVNAKASRPLLESLRADGVVVVTMVHEVDASPPFAHCGWNQQDVGIALARALLDERPEGGYVALLTHDAQSDVATVGEDRGAYNIRQQWLGRELSKFAAWQVTGEYPCHSAETVKGRLMQSLKDTPALDAWISVGHWPGSYPASDRPVEGGSAVDNHNRLLVFSDPRPQSCLPLEIASDVRCVAPDYGLVAPTALEMATSLLSGHSMTLSRKQIPIEVLDADGLSGFAERWRVWTGEPASHSP